MTLHTFNKSPAQGHAMFRECLRALAPGDSLLLLEDGVYAALSLQDADSIFSEMQAAVSLYVLTEDLAARGISARIRAEFSRVTYQGFVSLCLAHNRVVNWN